MSFGIIVVSASIGISQALDLGVAPIDTLVRTLVDVFSLNFTLGVYLTNFSFVIICLMLLKFTKETIPSILVTVIPVLLMGYVITFAYDFSLNVLHVQTYSFILKCIILLTAIISLSLGLNCTIKANVLLTPYDKLILGLASIFKTHYGQARILLDIMLFVIALLIGLIAGYQIIFGVGTVAYMFGVGMSVNATSRLFKL